MTALPSMSRPHHPDETAEDEPVEDALRDIFHDTYIDPVGEELQRRNDELSETLRGIGGGLDTTPWLPALVRRQAE